MAKHATKSARLQLVDTPKSLSVQLPLALLGALASAERDFFDLCVHVGREVFDTMMEQDRETLCGPKGRHDPERQAVRGGSARSEITLGGRRIPLRRLRARGDDGELALPSFVFAADRDPLDRHTMDAIACGVSTRKYHQSLEPLRSEPVQRSTSKSAVSRRFVALSQQKMTAWLSRPLDDLDLRVLVLDGIVFSDHTILVALGVDSDGRKHVLNLREGTTENRSVAKSLLRDLLERGLDPDCSRLFVIDGSKALRSAIRETFGALSTVQRCQIHKRRNVLDHLPEALHASVDRVLREVWDGKDAALAKQRLEKLARSLEAEHPGAASSIREGLEETLTLQRLGVRGALYRTLRSTNTIENLNGSIVTYTRNVKRWRGGSMLVRWISAAVLDAQQRFRRIRGHRDLAGLIRALDSSEVSKRDSQRVA